MRFVMFYHSLRSDWNHGNAHFLRGIATELIVRGHEVCVLESNSAWSAQNLASEYGAAALDQWRRAYALLTATVYDPNTLDLDAVLDGADVVIVHEWNEHELVARIGEHHARGGAYRLLFHDTHHRAATQPEAMAAYDLRNYNGVLAYGRAVRDIYIERAWTQRAWVWHEAADVRVFQPIAGVQPQGDLVWIGNWGDDERTAELEEFLIGPVEALGLRARIHGVRYPDHACRRLSEADIEYAGWLPNYEAPRAFAEHRVTVHVPRRPYVRTLAGIPTIRVFEALACGIPLVCAPWIDAEGLFTPGKDYLVAENGAEMRRHLDAVLNDADLAAELAAHGLSTIRKRHTCAHRVDELLGILSELGAAREETPALLEITR